MSLADAAGGLRLAVGTLTVVPSGDVTPVTRERAAWAMALAPVAALPVGLVVAVVALVGHGLHVPAVVTGALAVGGAALATRAMHLDGLADTVDGLGAGLGNRERAMAVMRKGDVGPMGVVALVVVLLAQAVSVGTLSSSVGGCLLAGLAVVLGRVGCAAASVRGVPAARSDGLGALVASSVPPLVVLGWVVVAGLLLAVVGGLPGGAGPAAGPLGVLLAVAAVGWLLVRVLRTVGGVTGDTMGAAVEVATTVLLVALAAGISS